jgi:LysR family transcriptional regulator AphB
LAAQQLGLPKSNVSRKVTRLEQSLGVRLLERSTRSLHLSEVGQQYFDHCQRIHEELQHANQSIESLTALPRGQLRIGASVVVGQSLLAPLLGEFYHRYPQVNIDLVLANRRMEMIEEGFDLLVRVGESPDSNLISKKLTEIDLSLYATPTYLANNPQPLNQLSDLAQHQCLYMGAVSGKPQWPLRQQSGQHINVTPAFRCDDFTVIKQMVMADGGVALLPDYLAATPLVKVLTKQVGRNVGLYAIYPSHRSVTPKLRVILDYLKAQLAK